MRRRIQSGVQALVVAGLLFLAGGCDTASETALLSSMFGLGAMTEVDPGQAAAYSVMSDAAGWEANRQAQEELKEKPQHVVVENR